MTLIWIYSLITSFHFQRLVEAGSIAFYIPPSSEDEYFRRSIFRALQEYSGQLSTKLQTYEYSYLNTSDSHRATVIRINIQEEQYSFRTNTGRYEVPDTEQFLTHLYIDGKEIHSFREGIDEKFCDSRPFTKLEFQKHLLRWVPLELFDQDVDYNLLGLNALLELLYKTYENDKKKVNCRNAPFEGKEVYSDWTLWASPRKCSITFGETLRLDYNLVSSQNFTDYPTIIQLHQRTDREWELRRQFKYLNFTATFAEEQRVSLELPDGKQCKSLQRVEAQP